MLRGGMLLSQAFDDPGVFGDVGDRPDDVGVGMHRHAEPELSWVSAGTQRVMTEAGVWLVPSDFAVWVPGDLPHDGSKRGAGSFHWIKLEPAAAAGFPTRACAVRVTPELRAALELVVQPEASVSDLQAARSVLGREVRDAGLRPVPIPLVRPPLLEPIITRLSHEPSDDRPLEEWAAFLRISSSTLSRAFQEGLGVSFRELRHALRLLAALEWLAQGERVADVARRLGYQSVSMFVELFRKKLGATPSRYFEPRAQA